MSNNHESFPLPSMAELKPKILPFAKPDTRRSLGQLANTLLPYLALWVLMFYSLRVSYWLTLALALLAAGFLVRVFIFFHDCGHNSFFPETRTNRWVGFLLGVLVFTPSEHWWHSHAIHHATSGNLDKRGVGDVTLLTVQEYRQMPWYRRLGYRLFRNPFVMFLLGPLYMFLIMHRFPAPRHGRRENLNVLWTNLAIAALAAALMLAIGWKAYVLIQLPVIWFAGIMGIWMFYVQHQFEGSYYERSGKWNYVASALQGASYYHLPRLLQWFTGNIGFHHIHHLNPRIPNYNLPACHESVPEIRQCARVIEFGHEFSTLRCKLWDEQARRMTGFRAALSPKPQLDRA